MGANGSKSSENRRANLSSAEYSRLEAYFKTACEKQGCLNEKNILSLWDGQIEESILQLLTRFFFKTAKTIDFHTFIKPYEVFVHGSNEEKTRLLCTILAGNENANELSVMAINDYVCSIVSSYILQMEISQNKDLLSWQTEKFEVRAEDVKLFADYLCSGLSQVSGTVSVEVLEKWIFMWSRIAALEKFAFRRLYSIGPDEYEEDREVKFIPRCVMLPRLTSHPSILDISNLICLNSSLPTDLRDQWRLLFSTKVHGQSFAKLMQHITNIGPTVLIIEDKGGHIFGGFATHSWKLGPNFTGDEGSFLFTLRPEVNMYFPSGYNDHFQYINIQQQTFPNGLGMGGQLDYFGLWLDAEFGKGHCSETCTTYKHYKMLSSSKQFEVNHIEVWGVGPEPKPAEDEGKKKSILDQDLQAQAVLEMSGKSYHSDGYRDPIEEEEDED